MESPQSESTDLEKEIETDIPVDNDENKLGLKLALASAKVAEENRGRDIMVLDMRKLTPIFDYFVIATGSSRRQLHAISEDIDNKLEKELKDKRLSREGYDDSHWIVLDYGNVVIHLFDEETREYYRLEDRWGDAERVDLSDIIGKENNEE
ncbi:MAG: ribosome silencing factor [Pirellulales bacterium]